MKGLKIVETKGMTPEELEDLKKKREEHDRLAKQAKNKEFLGNIKKSKLTRDSSGKDRFYLPVLHINDPTQWPGQPMDGRLHFTNEVAMSTCLGRCCGVEGLKAGCCYLDPEDMEHVLGPVDEEWVEETVRWLRKQGVAATRSDVVIDFEEGKIIGEKFFSGDRKQVFMLESTYPIIRFQVVGPRFACKFLNPVSGKCSIYPKRPNMCRGYLCEYVKANFLVRTANHPNTYKKLR